MTYIVLDDDGAPLDAHLDIEGTELVFHSRGGKRGAPGARNLDYGPALRLLLHRLAGGGRVVSSAWIDSDEVLALDRTQRSILDGATTLRPDAQFTLMSRNMQAFGRPAGAAYGGSRVKKIRIATDWDGPTEGLVALLRLDEVLGAPRARGRLPAKMFDAVTAEHIWQAIQMLEAGAPHPFGEPQDFELIAEGGARFAPKAVFGTAARLALSIEIRPEHFTGGVASRCHRMLERAGFEIVERGAPSAAVTVPLTDEDREWAEGRARLVTHLRRERAPGLSKAKKAAFVREFGRLHCERCGLDPVAVFGAAIGEACIEVHHRRVALARMNEGHLTSLDDLECLCANCHRVVHALLRAERR